MCLHFTRSLKTKSVLWFPLYELVDEISCSSGPAFRKLLLSDSNLFGQHLLTNFLAGTTFVGSFSQHEFVTANTKCIVVNCYSVVLTAHYLGGCEIINTGNKLELPIYPGVPLVSHALSGLQYLAIPISVILRQPL